LTTLPFSGQNISLTFASAIYFNWKQHF